MTKSTEPKDFLTSVRRTVVPIVMGWVATLPVAPFIDTAAIESALVAAFASAYYITLRWLEERGVNAAGWWIAFGRTPKPAYLELQED